jgi:hypothetical protein
MALVGVVPDASIDAVVGRDGGDAPSWCPELPEDATVVVVVTVVDRRKNSNSFRSDFGGWAFAPSEPQSIWPEMHQTDPVVELLFFGWAPEYRSSSTGSGSYLTCGILRYVGGLPDRSIIEKPAYVQYYIYDKMCSVTILYYTLLLVFLHTSRICT